MTVDVEKVLAQQPSGLPRYTSYPPASHFLPGGARQQLDGFLQDARDAKAISLYIHVPFCDRMCWFCGCHTKQTLRYEPVAQYVMALCGEIGLWSQAIAKRIAIDSIHFGGGSPSLLRDAELQHLRDALDDAFDLTGIREISFEIDPSDVVQSDVHRFARFGMTRASIGVQDFDPLVQAAINRPQSFELTQEVVGALRETGIHSINIDALYGLPHQTAQRLQSTIDKVLLLQPDRIALFGYAHVPWLKGHQRLIDSAALPGQLDRFQHAALASRKIVAAGYEAIGIDHFAKPPDRLAQAAREGRLHRNFQGYTDDDTTVRLGLGPSSIGCCTGAFLQNEVATGLYAARIDKGELPLARGLELNREDRLFADVIERLMCDFCFDFGVLENRHGASVAAPAIALAKKVAAEDRDGLCRIRGLRFEIVPEARALVRIVAARFDQWMARANHKYSKVV